MSAVAPCRRDIVVIGGSAGAVEALRLIAGALPSGLPAAVFVVVHIPATSLSALSRILDRSGPLPAAPAVEGDAISPGRILVAPPDHHLLLGEASVHLTSGPREHGHRPSADALFRSAARHHGRRVVGVVLTGMLGDGAAGLARIVAAGGLGIVQDPSDAAFSSMPERAVAEAAPQHIAPLSDIAPLIVEAVGKGEPAVTGSGRVAAGASVPAARNPGMISGDVAEAEDREGAPGPALTGDDRPGRPSGYACPDCGGVLWERDGSPALELVCRVGHLYNLQSLLEAKTSAVEGALWAGVRALEERVSVARRMAESQAEGSMTRAQLDEEARERQRQAEMLRALLTGPRSPG